MQLEAGKYYVDRRGRVYGPLFLTGTYYGETAGSNIWHHNGWMSVTIQHEGDLIAEYVPEPSPELSMRDCCSVRPRKVHPASSDPHMIETENVAHALRPGVDSVWNGNAWIPYTGRKTRLGMTGYARARFAKSAAPVASPRDINYIPRYADGWKPETALFPMASHMLNIILHADANSEERVMAASTLVEAVYPEILACKQ